MSLNKIEEGSKQTSSTQKIDNGAIINKFINPVSPEGILIGY